MAQTTTLQPQVRRELIREAERCSVVAGGYPHGWERTTLETMAGHCRKAATVFDLDSTLATEPEDTGRFRSLYLIAEIGRQVRAAVKRTATDFRKYTDQHRRDDREFAELSTARAGELATAAVVVLPRLTSLPDGMLLVSQARFAANHDLLVQAGELLRRAVGPSLRLDVTDPRVAKVVEIAAELERLAKELEAEHAADQKKLHLALGFRDEREDTEQP